MSARSSTSPTRYSAAGLFPRSKTDAADRRVTLPPTPPSRNSGDLDTHDDIEGFLRLQRRPTRAWFLMAMTAAQTLAMFSLFIINYQLTGSLIETSPFNVMLGPGAYTLIRSGARFVPCMKANTSLSGASISCPAKISSNGNGTCTVNDLCGLDSSATPGQWWRFIVPIFLHGGLLHLLFNLMFQVQTGFKMELDFGWWRMALIYFSSGIFGFIFGGNFASELSPSVGCSGALFGLLGCIVLDLLMNWRATANPWSQLFTLGATVVISFLVGLLPGIDNFSHIGGFIMGILAGLVLMPRRHFGKRDQIVKTVLMVVAVPLMLLLMIGLLVSFYNNSAESLCSWCHYLGCVPIAGLCDIGVGP